MESDLEIGLIKKKKEVCIMSTHFSKGQACTIEDNFKLKQMMVAMQINCVLVTFYHNTLDIGLQSKGSCRKKVSKHPWKFLTVQI
jgi:hypothetical protein